MRIYRLRPAALGIATAVLLAACGTDAPIRQPSIAAPATQTPQGTPLSPQMTAAAEALTEMAARQDRLYRVAAPLMIDNAELCPKHVRNLLGFTAKNRYSYPGIYNEAAHVAFGMDEQLQVTSVLAGSGAAKAGLRLGDALLAAAGKALPTGPNALAGAGAVFGPIVASQAKLPLTVEREGKQRDLNIPATRACGFGIELGNADLVNAYADGPRVLVTRGMLDVTKSDEELAYVLARTMAHNILEHPKTQRNQATLDSVIDNLVRVNPDTAMLSGSGGIKPMPGNLDAAADRLAIFMLARAGYGIDGAPGFWKRFAASHPVTVANGFTASHPSTAARLTALELAIEDVKARKSGKKALLP